MNCGYIIGPSPEPRPFLSKRPLLSSTPKPYIFASPDLGGSGGGGGGAGGAGNPEIHVRIRIGYTGLLWHGEYRFLFLLGADKPLSAPRGGGK